MNYLKNITGIMFPPVNATDENGQNLKSTNEYHDQELKKYINRNGSHQKKPMEIISSEGKITVYDEEMNIGVVDGRYRFDIGKFAHMHLRANLPIIYTVVKSPDGRSLEGEISDIQIRPSEPEHEVTLLTPVVKKTSALSIKRDFEESAKKHDEETRSAIKTTNSSQGNDDVMPMDDERLKIAEIASDLSNYVPYEVSHIPKPPPPSQKKMANLRTIVCKASYFEPEYIYAHQSTSTEKIRIGRGFFGPSDFVLVGDWLNVCIENDGELDFLNPKIISVQWAEKGILVGRIALKSGFYCVKDVFIPEKELKKKGMDLKVGDQCKVTYVLSDQQKTRPDGITKQFFTKRSCFVETVTENDVKLFEEDSGIARYSKILSRICKNKNHIVIEPELLQFGEFKLNSCVKKSIDIHNRGHKRVFLEQIKLQGDQTVCKFSFEIVKPETDGILKVIDPDSTVSLMIVAEPKLLGKTQELCIFDFGSFCIGRKITIRGISDSSESLQATQLTSVIKNKALQIQQKQEDEKRLKKMLEENKATVIPGPATVRNPFFLPTRLPAYRLPVKLEQIFIEQVNFQGKGSQLLLQEYPDCDWKILNYENYLTRFHMALWLEELESIKIRKDLDLSDISLTVDDDLVFFHVPYLSDTKPVLNVGERVRCYYTNIADETESDLLDNEGDTDSDNEEEAKQHVIHDGYIHVIHGQRVYARFEKFHKTYNNSPVNVTFKQRRTSQKRQHHALEYAATTLGEIFLFPNEDLVDIKPARIQFVEISASERQPKKTLPLEAKLHVSADDRKKNFKNLPDRKMTDFRAANIYKPTAKTVAPTSNDTIKEVGLTWYNPALNQEQKDAVRRILRGQCRPLPYIIFGPPGTGKSVTVVEAVMQINKLDRLSRILIAVPSNQAGDLLAERLVKSEQYVPGDFIRFNGFMRAGQRVSDVIVPYCSTGENLTFITRHRIIISTISTAGQFFQLGLAPDHFTHVFIDEAGYATEPETLIACVLAATSKDGQIILSGDPNQLMPVLHHRSEVHKILRRSFLERLMNTTIYAPNPEKFAETYNPIFVTMLTKSYRLPPALLDLPSQRFYNGHLVSKAPTDYDLLKKLKFLPNEQIPLMFHGVIGRSQHSGSPSWCNVEEICQCLSYITELRKAGVKSGDIGVISLYRKQVDVLKTELAKVYSSTDEDIPKVATIHEFQGGERKIIIITTVLSMHSDVLKKFTHSNVFIMSSKIFNVAITRAKALLVIIGDPCTLQYSNDWMDMIRYCAELGVYEGCQLPTLFRPIACPSWLSELEGKGRVELDAEENPEADSGKPDDDLNDGEDGYYDDSEVPGSRFR